MDDGLHIKLIKGNENQSKFDPSFGSLVLNKAGVFQVTVKEYEDRRKPIDDAAEKADKRAREKWNTRAKEHWAKEKLQENWEANQKEINGKKKADSDKLVLDFKDVNWVWVVAPKQLNKAELSHNESFSKGISGSGIYNIHFPKVLEGGGIAYLEAFLPVEGVKASKPFGVFVQATGVPKIVRVEWTDFDYNPLDKKLVSFYSEVLLHIYTEGLYGQELKIQLFDEDVFDDDELQFSDATEFKREVDIQKVHKKEYNKTGIADELVKSEQNKGNNTIEKEHYIQKITVEVFVDPKWKKEGGNVLKIYPTIKSEKTGNYFEKFSRECLNVSEDGDFYNTPKEVSNMPAVQSNINTNVANYHTCQYTEIDYIDPKSVTNIIFKEKSLTDQNQNLEIGIIVGSDPKKFTLKVDDKANTTECRFDGKPKDHNKNIFTYDNTKLPANIKITKHEPKSIEGEANFTYNLTDLPKYFWLSESNMQSISTLDIEADTCRHQNKIKLMIVPEIEWTINFFYNTPDPVWYGQSSPTYDIYRTESTAVRDNTSIGDMKNSKDRIALEDLRKEENIANANVKGGKRKIATAANRYFGDRKSNFGLSVKATYDGGKSQELSYKFWEKYRKRLVKLNYVYDLVDRIAGAKDARGASDSLPPSLAGRRNMMSLSLIPSAPSVGVSWKYIYENNKVGIELSGKVKIVPLIGGDLLIDLLAFADKIPIYGKFIAFLDLTTWLIEKLSFNSLSVNYRIDLTFYANLALEEAFVKWNSAKPDGERFDTDMKFSGTIGGKLELEMGLKLSNKQIKKFPELDLQAGVKADCSFKVTLSPNFDKDNKVDITTKFSGLLITVYYKFSMKGNSKNKAPETLDPFKLIGAYTGTPVSIKIGEGDEQKH